MDGGLGWLDFSTSPKTTTMRVSAALLSLLIGIVSISASAVSVVPAEKARAASISASQQLRRFEEAWAASGRLLVV